MRNLPLLVAFKGFLVSAIAFQFLVGLLAFPLGALLQKLSLRFLGNDDLEIVFFFFAECAVAFAAILIGAHFSPVRYRVINCFIFAAAGLLIYSWIFLNFLLPFERHREVHDSLYYLLTDLNLDSFAIGGVCACVYLMLWPGKDFATSG